LNRDPDLSNQTGHPRLESTIHLEALRGHSKDQLVKGSRSKIGRGRKHLAQAKAPAVDMEVCPQTDALLRIARCRFRPTSSQLIWLLQDPTLVLPWVIDRRRNQLLYLPTRHQLDRQAKGRRLLMKWVFLPAKTKVNVLSCDFLRCFTTI